MFKPCCPNAGPTGGAAVAFPAGKLSFKSVLTFLAAIDSSVEERVPRFGVVFRCSFLAARNFLVKSGIVQTKEDDYEVINFTIETIPGLSFILSKSEGLTVTKCSLYTRKLRVLQVTDENDLACRLFLS